MDIIDLKDGHATPKFWVLVNYDNILEYSNYDISALNETNCSISNLPNGIEDILITGFYPPEQQPPARKSGKGEGLLT